MDQLTARPRRAALGSGVTFAVVAVALYLFWPVGVAVGLVAGVWAMATIGFGMREADAAAPTDIGLEAQLALEPDPEDELARDVARLRATLGTEFADFARAAELVVGAQRASVAAVQRGLGVTVNRARRLVELLEAERFIGPANGTRPRDVLVAADHLPDLQRLFAAE